MSRDSYKAIPDPQASLNSLREAALATKEVVELLTRQRLPAGSSAVVWDDLVGLGLVSANRVPGIGKDMTGGGGSAESTAIGIAPNCGRLSVVSGTQIQFVPYNGEFIRIGGVIYRIPSAGIPSGNTGAFVNGAAGQSLAANTTYNVYLFNNSGALALDFSTTGHSTSATAGNVGTETKSGDDTRTIVGKTRTGAGGVFQADNDGSSTTPGNIWTTNWFNRRLRTVMNGNSGSVVSAAAAWFNISNSGSNVVTWGDKLTMSAVGLVGVDTQGGAGLVNCTVDGAVVGLLGEFQAGQNGYLGAADSVFSGSVAEGAHTLSLSGGAGGGTATWYGGDTGFIAHFFG